MKLGYLLNTYPTTSQTFVRREIQALEAQGVEIVRYAIRRWSEKLVNEADRVEQTKTRYILSGRILPLITCFFVELLLNPLGVVRAVSTWFRLMRNAGGGFIRHTAYLLEAVSLKRWAARDQVTFVHSHFATNATAVALLSARLGGPSYSFTVHGQDEFDDSRASLKEKLDGARVVIAISDFARVQVARLAGLSDWDKIQVVRCGIDVREFEPSKASFDGNTTFVCVGRLCPQKAQTLIIEALDVVRRTHPQVRLLLVGDGESRADVEARIERLKLQDHATLLGWRSNSEVRELVGAARALLLPSLSEGLPIALMEAQALERPVITTFIAGIPELVDQRSGWIIPAGSVDQIADAMIAALDAPSELLTRMGQEGRRRVIEAHSIDQNAARLRSVLVQNTLSR